MISSCDESTHELGFSVYTYPADTSQHENTQPCPIYDAWLCHLRHVCELSCYPPLVMRPVVLRLDAARLWEAGCSFQCKIWSQHHPIKASLKFKLKGNRQVEVICQIRHGNGYVAAVIVMATTAVSISDGHTRN